MRLLLLLLLVGCESGLARLWRVPAPTEAGPPTELAPVVGLSGRMGIAAAASEPSLLEPAPGDRLIPRQVLALGQGLWLVRVQLPLPKTYALDALAPALGFEPTERHLRAGLRALPRARLGLSLDRELRIVADQSGQQREGRLVSCGGDPVESQLHLLACLALGRGVEPDLSFDTGNAELDIGNDAGPPASAAGSDGGTGERSAPRPSPPADGGRPKDGP